MAPCRHYRGAYAADPRRASVALNQTPLDWDGNSAASCGLSEARAGGASVLCLPELCITGYGCEDAFHSPACSRTALEVLRRDRCRTTRGMIVAAGPAAALPQGAVQRGVSRWSTGAIARLRGQALPRRRRHPLRAALVQALAARRAHGEVEIGGRDVSPRRPAASTSAASRIGFEICEDAWVADRPGSRPGASRASTSSSTRAPATSPSASTTSASASCSRARGPSASPTSTPTCWATRPGRMIYDGGAMIAIGGRARRRRAALLLRRLRADHRGDRRRRRPACARRGRRATARARRRRRVRVSVDFALPAGRARAPPRRQSAGLGARARRQGGGVHPGRRARALRLPAQEPLPRLRRLALAAAPTRRPSSCLVALMVELGGRGARRSRRCSRALAYIPGLDAASRRRRARPAGC